LTCGLCSGAIPGDLPLIRALWLLIPQPWSLILVDEVAGKLVTKIMVKIVNKIAHQTNTKLSTKLLTKSRAEQNKIDHEIADEIVRKIFREICRMHFLKANLTYRVLFAGSSGSTLDTFSEALVGGTLGPFCFFWPAIL